MPTVSRFPIILVQLTVLIYVLPSAIHIEAGKDRAVISQPVPEVLYLISFGKVVVSFYLRLVPALRLLGY